MPGVEMPKGETTRNETAQAEEAVVLRIDKPKLYALCMRHPSKGLNGGR